MNYGEIKKNDIANGEGVRTSLFVSGCRNHCENCFNQVTWDFLFGNAFTKDIEDEIIESVKPEWINGLSILGGEPFEPENQGSLLSFVRRFRQELPQKTIWCYSGFTFEEITGDTPSRAFTDISNSLLGEIDILVDGKYVEALHDISLIFRGSSNQRVIDVQKSLKENKVILYIE